MYSNIALKHASFQKSLITFSKHFVKNEIEKHMRALDNEKWNAKKTLTFFENKYQKTFFVCV